MSARALSAARIRAASPILSLTFDAREKSEQFRQNYADYANFTRIAFYRGG